MHRAHGLDEVEDRPQREVLLEVGEARLADLLHRRRVRDGPRELRRGARDLRSEVNNFE